MTTDFPTGLAFDDAARIVDEVAASRRLPVEHVPLSRAHGRILARDVVAPIALQPFDNSAMDGYALRHADLDPDGESVLRLAGEQFAGPDRGLQLRAGECARITTGAPMPVDADTVAIREQVQADGEGIRIPPGIRRGANVRRAGRTCAPAIACSTPVAS